jgi:hypothetical protein
MTGRISIPAPFNENDFTVWNALVCKYICQNKDANFNKSDFLGAVIDDKISPLGAYNKEMIKKASAGEQNQFYELLKSCLKFLRENRLIEFKKEKNSKAFDEGYYIATERLKSICIEIAKVLMPSIKSVLEAEREALTEMNYRNIAGFLEHLDKVNEFRKSDSTKYVTHNELYKLAQLGVITLYSDVIRIDVTMSCEMHKPYLYCG